MRNAERLAILYGLYRPNVTGGPNFSPASNQRGGNEMLAKCIDALGLASPGEVAAEFARRDEADRRAHETLLAAVNAR